MFDQVLQRIVDETGGAVGAVLMGYDGIAIEQYFPAEEALDLQIVAIEYSNVIKDIRKTSEVLKLGNMEEVSIKTERFIIVIRAITSEYFVALTLYREGNFGKGRYLLTRETANMGEALV